MPKAGYGRYPVNFSLVISEQMKADIDALTSGREPQAETTRRILAAGIKALQDEA
jgi:hypothetical protein